MGAMCLCVGGGRACAGWCIPINCAKSVVVCIPINCWPTTCASCFMVASDICIVASSPTTTRCLRMRVERDAHWCCTRSRLLCTMEDMLPSVASNCRMMQAATCCTVVLWACMIAGCRLVITSAIAVRKHCACACKLA